MEQGSNEFEGTQTDLEETRCCVEENVIGVIVPLSLTMSRRPLRTP